MLPMHRNVSLFFKEACLLHDKVLLVRKIYFAVSQLEKEKGSLNSQRAASEQEKNGFHDRLLRLEREKMDLESEKSGQLNLLKNFK